MVPVPILIILMLQYLIWLNTISLIHHSLVKGAKPTFFFSLRTVNRKSLNHFVEPFYMEPVLSMIVWFFIEKLVFFIVKAQINILLKKYMGPCIMYLWHGNLPCVGYGLFALLHMCVHLRNHRRWQLWKCTYLIKMPRRKHLSSLQILLMQSNPGWGFDKKCQFMDKLVWEVSQHYK